LGLAMPLLNILGSNFTETDFILSIQFDTDSNKIRILILPVKNSSTSQEETLSLHVSSILYESKSLKFNLNFLRLQKSAKNSSKNFSARYFSTRLHKEL
jgi:hypothetical protein